MKEGLILLSLTGEHSICVRLSFALGVRIRLLVRRQKLRCKKIFGPHTALTKVYLCYYHKNQRYQNERHLKHDLLAILGRIYYFTSILTHFFKRLRTDDSYISL